MDSTGILTTKIDKSQIPPLHQKRILAFVNHFLINSCSFLNDFAEKCEYKFIEVERKLQKVEAALTIIEAKLSSIPNLEVNGSANNASANNMPVESQKEQIENAMPTTEAEPTVETESGVIACNDMRYKKFFKMLQVGVPAPAVKLKMKGEGLDERILDTPNAVLADGRIAEAS